VGVRNGQGRGEGCGRREVGTSRHGEWHGMQWACVGVRVSCVWVKKGGVCSSVVWASGVRRVPSVQYVARKERMHEIVPSLRNARQRQHMWCRPPAVTGKWSGLGTPRGISVVRAASARSRLLSLASCCPRTAVQRAWYSGTQERCARETARWRVRRGASGSVKPSKKQCFCNQTAME